MVWNQPRGTTHTRLLSGEARRRSEHRGDDPRYRCVICWALNPWSEGCGDELDRLFSSLVDQAVYVDRGRRRSPTPVTDAGLCSACWCAINPISLVEADAEALQQLPVAPGCDAGLLGP